MMDDDLPMCSVCGDLLEDDGSCESRDEAIAEQVELEAIRQAVNCPTCGGSRLLPGKCDGSLGTYGECLGFHPCLDCTDGHPPMARLLRIAVLTLTVDPDRHTFPTQQALLDYLRSVTP